MILAIIAHFIVVIITGQINVLPIDSGC